MSTVCNWSLRYSEVLAAEENSMRLEFGFSRVHGPCVFITITPFALVY